jgi:SAM-dependent methyltransferase
LDATTKRVVEMYSQYPWPLVDRRYDIFKYTEYPFIRKFGNIGSILDAGCGTGNVANAIAQLLPETRVVGMDVVEESLRIARESAANLHLRNVEFRNSDLLSHDPELGTFDFVHCWGVIHHLSDPRKGLENLHKYLNPGRYAYIWVYMLLGRRWILDIREMLTLLGTTDKSYEERIEWTKKILLAYYAEKLPEGLKRHHDQNKPIASRLLRMLESSIHLLSDSGWKALIRKVMKKFLGKPDSSKTLFSSEPKIVDAELEDRMDRITLADKFLHPHSVYFRMSEILNLVTEIGFSEVRISEGMSANLQQFFSDDLPDIRQAVANLPIEKQYQFMELVEKPAGLGFFVRKPG